MAEEYRIDLKLQPDTQGVSAATADINRYEDKVEKAQRTTSRWTGATAGAAAGVTNLGNQAELAGKKAAGMGRVMKTILAYMAAFASYATVKSVVRGFGEWELGLVGISKTTKLTKKEIEELGEAFLKFARMNPTDANTLTAIAKAAGQVGVEGKKNMQIFTETVAKLVESSNLGAEESVFYLKKVLDLTGETTDESLKLASVWVKLGNTMAATESQIARTTQEVAKGTAAFDVPYEDASAIAASLVISGTAPEMSRSTMLRIFSSMNKAIQGNSKLMQNWTEMMRMSSEEFAKAWSEDKGQLFVDFVGAVKREGANAEAALEKLNIQGLRAVPAVLGLAKVYDTGLAPALERARKEAATTGEALNREYGKFRLAFVNIQATVGHVFGELSDLLGEELAPTLIKMTKSLRSSVAAYIDSGRALETFHKIASGFSVLMANMADILRVLAAYVLFSLTKMFAKWAASLVVANGRLVIMTSLLKGLRLALGVAALYLGSQLIKGFTEANAAVHEFNANMKTLSETDYTPNIKVNAADIMAVEIRESMEKAVKVVAAAFVGITATLGAFFRYSALNLVDLIKTVFERMGIELQIKLQQLIVAVQSTLNRMPIVGSIQLDTADNEAQIARLREQLEGVQSAPVTFQQSYAAVQASGRPAELQQEIEDGFNRVLGRITDAGTGAYMGQPVQGLPADQVRAAQAEAKQITEALDVQKKAQEMLYSSTLPTKEQGKARKEVWGHAFPKEDKIDAMTIRWREAMKEMKAETQNLFVHSVPAAIGDSVIAIMEGAARIQDVFRDLARMILSTMIQVIVELTARMLIVQALTGTAFGNWIGLEPPAGSAGGGAGGPSPGGLGGAAKGGLYSPRDLPGGATGGLFSQVQGYMRGGPVFGPGTGTSDGVNARLSAGEFVVNKRNTDRFAPLLHAINSYSGSGSRPSESSGPGRVVIEDHRPPESPRLDVEVMPGLNPRQVNELRVLVREENSQARKTGREDSQLRSTYGLHRRPVRRG